MAWVAGGSVLLLALLYLLFFRKSGEFGSIVTFLIVCLLVYRHFRHRSERQLKRFASRIGKLPEVRVITCQQGAIVVVVDKMQAKIYLRVNSLLESMNKKLFFGKPMTASVRDDVPQEELRRMLQQPGILYVRDDVFL
jgi:hypothetical protein